MSVAAVCRGARRDLEQAVASVRGSSHARVMVVVPASEAMAQVMVHRPAPGALEAGVDLVKRARDLDGELAVDVCLADASRADHALMAHYAGHDRCRGGTDRPGGHGRGSTAGRLPGNVRPGACGSLPLRAGARPPAWLAPAGKDGWVLLFGARWQPLGPLLDEHPVLYVSSANRTGLPPAATTAEALAMFPATVPVLRPPHRAAGPAGGPAGGPARRATTTVTVHPDGRLTLHRHGAQDRLHPHPDDYLDHLRARYCSQRSL
ncbi:hypothetical protein OG592_36880 [Streptomyces avidinii]|uniref:hypothetical protein n=1 Tax=Streptomyces avidinii TaxID=1895 RepID=UPI0038653648|nr:hypothetical protein OG592_36880 [Streptomyces avidinii]